MSTPPRYRTADLDDFERLPAFGEADVWRPVRHHFGIEGFGVNAYTAREAGSRVIEEHDELAAADQGRHEEMYVVLTGAALFTLDGEDVHAPAGTFVFISAPDVRRGAVAVAPDTSVLAIGARPGRAFSVSPWEYCFRAQAKGGAEAIAILREGLARHPDNPTLHFRLACDHALAGEREAALASLARAIELDARARGWAVDDDDLDPLRGDPAFQSLVGA